MSHSIEIIFHHPLLPTNVAQIWHALPSTDKLQYQALHDHMQAVETDHYNWF